MSKDFQKSFMNVGGLAFASILLASCAQDWSTTGWFADPTKSAKSPYERGKSQMSIGHYGMAIESFRTALADDPQSVKVLNALAASYDLVGRYDLAERYYRQAMNIDPRSVQSLNNLGYSYYLRGRYADARVLFEKAARIDDKNPVVVANLQSLEKADAASKLAAAKAAEAKEPKAVAEAPWIERTTPTVQSLVTKADPDSLKEAGEKGVEPSIVHTPSPIIELATSSPIPIEVHKPQSRRLPAVAIAEGAPKGGPGRPIDVPKTRESEAVVRPSPSAAVAAPESDPTEALPGRRAPETPAAEDSAMAPRTAPVEAKPAEPSKGPDSTDRADPAAPVENPGPGPGTAAAAAPEESKPGVDAPIQTAALAGDDKKTAAGAGAGAKGLASEAASKELAVVGQSIQIEVSNGAGRLRMAARMNRYLQTEGVAPGRLTNARSFNNQKSVLYFLPGHVSKAKLVSDLLPMQPELRENAGLETHLRLVLGGDLLNFDRDLIYRFDK